MWVKSVNNTKSFFFSDEIYLLMWWGRMSLTQDQQAKYQTQNGLQLSKLYDFISWSRIKANTKVFPLSLLRVACGIMWKTLCLQLQLITKLDVPSLVGFFYITWDCIWKEKAWNETRIHNHNQNLTYYFSRWNTVK